MLQNVLPGSVGSFKNTANQHNKKPYDKTKKKSCFADIEGFYVGLGGWNNNINITFVLEYVSE